MKGGRESKGGRTKAQADKESETKDIGRNRKVSMKDMLEHNTTGMSVMSMNHA